MRQITPLSLISVLANLKGGTMVYLTSLTDVDVPFQYRLGRVQKFCRQSMQIGCSYENSVNNKLERKGLSRSFRSSRLRWGRWFILNRIIEHRGKYYEWTYFLDTYNNAIIASDISLSLALLSTDALNSKTFKA